MTHKLEIEISDKLREDLEAYAEDWQYTLEQMALHALHYFIEDMDDEETDEEILENIRIGLQQALRGEGRPAREVLDEILAKRREHAL
jgi:predicted transcriptional regulator